MSLDSRTGDYVAHCASLSRHRTATERSKMRPHPTQLPKHILPHLLEVYWMHLPLYSGTQHYSLVNDENFQLRITNHWLFYLLNNFVNYYYTYIYICYTISIVLTVLQIKKDTITRKKYHEKRCRNGVPRSIQTRKDKSDGEYTMPHPSLHLSQKSKHVGTGLCIFTITFFLPCSCCLCTSWHAIYSYISFHFLVSVLSC